MACLLTFKGIFFVFDKGSMTGSISCPFLFTFSVRVLYNRAAKELLECCGRVPLKSVL